jgi:hypothetical protein
MVFFKNVEVPLSDNLPDWSVVYGFNHQAFDPEKKREIDEKLHLIDQYEDKAENFFFHLGLLERYSIRQSDSKHMFCPENYESYKLRALRLMDIFGCVTENSIEDEKLYKAFLYGVIDLYKVYHKVFDD